MNLYRSIQDTIKIPVSSDPFILEAVERKEKISKNWIFQEQKELFRQEKNHFSKFSKCFLLVIDTKKDPSFNKISQLLTCYFHKSFLFLLVLFELYFLLDCIVTEFLKKWSVPVFEVLFGLFTSWFVWHNCCPGVFLIDILILCKVYFNNK